MADQVIKTTFLLRRGLRETWKKNNPILAYGEPGFEKDTNRLKIGDGTRAWIDLPYLNGSDYNISADGKSVEIANNVLALYGFADAAVGTYPVKNELGVLEWVKQDSPLSDEEIYAIIGKED